MKNKIIRILLSVLFVIIFLLYIGPVITVGEYNLGIIAGLGFDFILLIYIIFFNKINLLIKSINKKKDYDLSDDGLYFIVRKNSSNSFRLDFRYGGK